MHLTRRALLKGAMICQLAGCSAAALTPAAIIADAQAAATGLSAMLAGLTTAFPTLLPPATVANLKANLATAQTVAATLSANTPASTAATAVQQVLGVVNALLNTLAAPPLNGLIPAPFNIAVAAAAIIAPEMEAFVAQFLPTAAASPATAQARATFSAITPVMTPDAARALLAGLR